MSENRTPAGVPAGGQYAASVKPESAVTLDPPSTRQTAAPIVPLDLDISPRRAKAMSDMLRDGHLDASPPYQRGSVWTQDQRLELIRSFLSQTPIPALVLNYRGTSGWREANGTSPREDGGSAYVLIDGKQRVETVRDWYGDDLAVPATWFPVEDIVESTDTFDGPYVYYSGLSIRAQRDFAQNATLPVAEGTLTSIEAEAEMYLRVNGAGTAQSEADMDNAAAIARGTR